MKRALGYLLAITVAEVVTVVFQPLWGMLFHIIIFAVLVLHAALARQPVYHRLLLSLALVPLVRIVSLSMPLANIPQIWRYPLIYAPLVAATWQVTRLAGYRLGEIGLRLGQLSVQAAIALTGFVLGIAEYFILVEEAEATAPLLQPTWLLSAFLLITTTGFVEELMFRGVLQRSIEEAFGWWGIVYVSLIFAIVHLLHVFGPGYPRTWLDLVFVFVVALFFGWAVKKTGSLVGVILSHGIANAVLFLVAPILF